MGVEIYTHYIPDTMNPIKLLETSKKISLEIKKIQDNSNKPPLIVYSGMSGTSLATAVALDYSKEKNDLSMLYVRKSNDYNGNCEFFTEQSTRDFNLYFVDDFISSGATLKRCLNSLSGEEINAQPVINCITVYNSLWNYEYKTISFDYLNKKKRIKINKIAVN